MYSRTVSESVQPKSSKQRHSDNLRNKIINAKLNDEIWSAQVVMLNPAFFEQSRKYVRQFERFADHSRKRRMHIKNISMDHTLFMIKQIGRGLETWNDPMQLFYDSYNALRRTNSIPPDLLAVLVKQLMLRIREKCLSTCRKKREHENGKRLDSEAMLGTDEVLRSYSSSVLHDENLTDIVRPAKFTTELRTHDEDWKDVTYVEDHPIDGPQMYIILTGFSDNLFTEGLIKIGVPISGILQVRFDSISSSVSAKLRARLIWDESMRYWHDLLYKSKAKSTMNIYKNTAFLLFRPLTHVKVAMPDEKVYDEICFIMYDIHDLRKYHELYLNNLSIIELPEYNSEPDLFARYNSNMAHIPLECTTIYSVLGAVIESVSSEEKFCGSQTQRQQTSRPAHIIILGQKKSTKFEKTIKVVNDTFEILTENDIFKRYKISNGIGTETYKDPITIHYGDKAKYNTFHLRHLNLDSIVYRTLIGMPVSILWKKINDNLEEEQKKDHHVNILLSCFGRVVCIQELYRMMFLLTCRKLYDNRSSLYDEQSDLSTLLEYKNVEFKSYALLPDLANTMASNILKGSNVSMFQESRVAFPVHFAPNISRSRAEVKRFGLPEISELITDSEFLTGKPLEHRIDDYRYFENFEGVRSLQVLSEAYKNYNCLDYYYCAVTDSIVIMFFNNHNFHGVSRREWHSSLPTAVCFKDFYDFVYEEEHDWIQNEEIKLSEKISAEQLANTINEDDIDNCLNNLDFGIDLLVPNSLKYQELLKCERTLADHNISEHDYYTDANDMSHPSVVRNPILLSYLRKKYRKKKVKPVPVQTDSSMIIPDLPFSGYNISDRRIEFFGKEQVFFSKDGTKVISKFYSMLYPNDFDHLTMSVVPGLSKNNFTIHKNIENDDLKNVCGSFMITSEDGTIINVQTINKFDKLAKIKYVPSLSQLAIVRMTPVYHTLTLTLPNGLLIETIQNEPAYLFSSIKQTLLTQKKVLGEDCRYITKSGEVLVFKENGDLVIMTPAGEIITITQIDLHVKKRYHHHHHHHHAKLHPAHSFKIDYNTAIKESFHVLQDPHTRSNLHNISLKLDSEKQLKEHKLIHHHHHHHYRHIRDHLIISDLEYINPEGIKLKYEDHEITHEEQLLITSDNDYSFNIYSSTRSDGTSHCLDQFGTLKISFPDKTVITKEVFVEDIEIYVDMLNESATYECGSENDFEQFHMDGFVSVLLVTTIKHPNYAEVTVDHRDSTFTISTSTVSVNFDVDTRDYTFNLDDATMASFDGEYLNIDHETCKKCHSKSMSRILIYTDVTEPSYSSKPWLVLKDSFNIDVIVEGDGTLMIKEDITDNYYEDEVLGVHPDNTSKCEKSSGIPDNEMYSSCIKKKVEAHEMRFFNLKRDLSCMELIHRDNITDYWNMWEGEDFTFYNQKELFPDKRDLITIVTPLLFNQSEKWLMRTNGERRSKVFEVNEREHIEHKHVKKPTKGFYHWMRPYKIYKFESKCLQNDQPESLPNAFILRVLERLCSAKKECQQVNEFINAVFTYRKLVETNRSISLNYRDIWSEHWMEESKLQQFLYFMEERLNLKLSRRLKAEMHIRFKPDIVTTHEPIEYHESVVGEHDEDYRDIYNVSVNDTTPSTSTDEDVRFDRLARREKYWEQRKKDLKTELANKKYLRDPPVMPYFQSEFGGAFWTEDTLNLRKTIHKSCEPPSLSLSK